VAEFYGHKDIVELLIENGANPAIRNINGQTPKDIASKAGQRQVAEILRSAALAAF
jgi:ankyrin repeat protein